MYNVYILKCGDGNIYTGCTNDLSDRVDRHNKGYIPATKERRPVELINYTVFKDKYKAYKFEIYLKFGSGRAFIKKHFV